MTTAATIISPEDFERTRPQSAPARVTLVRPIGISVFFPCYNDAETIGELVTDADAVLRDLAADYEIIVINDGSKDASADVLSHLQAQIPRLRVITHPVNRGYGAALRSGFSAASKELVFYTDGDGQYDVRELPMMLTLLSDDVDVVNGIKMTRQDPAYRVFTGNLHKFATRWLLWLPITDVDCDFRLVRRWVLDQTRLKSSSGSICAELVKKAQRAGASFREVSVHHYPRRFGESQFFRLDKIVKTYLDLARLWLRVMVLDRETVRPDATRQTPQ